MDAGVLDEPFIGLHAPADDACQKYARHIGFHGLPVVDGDVQAVCGVKLYAQGAEEAEIRLVAGHG